MPRYEGWLGRAVLMSTMECSKVPMAWSMTSETMNLSISSPEASVAAARVN